MSFVRPLLGIFFKKEKKNILDATLPPTTSSFWCDSNVKKNIILKS